MTQGIHVVGGRKNFPTLTRKMMNQQSMKYDVYKIYCWQGMLRDRMQPTKWLKPTKDGTSVNFDFIRTVEQAEKAFQQFQDFVKEVNEKHNLDFEVERTKKEESSDDSPSRNKNPL